MEPEEEVEVKRKPGRPKGSKNKRPRKGKSTPYKAPSKKKYYKPKKAVGYTGKGCPPMAVSLTRKLKDVLGKKAQSVLMAKEYAESADLDPKVATVLDCIVHCQLYWAFHGSAPHSSQIWDRVDGKVPMKAEVSVDGKLGITEAIAAMKIGKEED